MSNTQTKVDARSRVVASVVVIKDDQILLVQEGHHRVHGKWSLPGGHVEEGETIEAAAIREALEEAGCEVELGRPLPIIHPAIESPVMHPFTAHITGGSLEPQVDDILATGWFSVAQLRDMEGELRNPHYIYSSLDALGL
jgi:ADP-ribose pyrophosphatase YjhB (NUDIX family)